ncbi:MAG: epoxyqueuosine reductase QueH [Lachnospiraceae bacterium]|nr:epoxyqueuosine reductase QueH [Lachnospiraceae bacterium]
MLEETIQEITEANKVPKLLLHSCCAPCSSYCLEYLSDYFEITVFYYNPNIYPDEEYFHRAREQQAFIERFPAKHPISFVEGDFDKERFFQSVKGLENEPERGARCNVCFELRLGEAASMARQMNMDYFTTTLSISPMKDAALLNDIGSKMEEKYGVKYLHSDFKKKNGYKRSCELSQEYGMYRQDYCGCVFSYNESKARRMEQKGQ